MHGDTTDEAAQAGKHHRQYHHYPKDLEARATQHQGTSGQTSSIDGYRGVRQSAPVRTRM